MNTFRKHKVIGVMSGTSLDGVDVLACEFWCEQNKWNYSLEKGETYAYPSEILKKLKNSQNLSAIDLTQFDVQYGRFLGGLVKLFMQENNYTPDFIASHGYTVFHEPNNGFTLQIGSGAEISSVSGVKTICNFRTTDVAHGGQGAPLVPVGDKLLFSEYAACLNLGGFSNISYDINGNRLAYDICPVNFILNKYAQKLGREFDQDGELGKTGKVDQYLLNRLNLLDYYSQKPPKSLGREFVEDKIYPLIPESLSANDVLATFYEHIAQQLAGNLNKLQNGDVLITGGGALNAYLISLLKKKCENSIIVPQKKIIDFKEALIFGFLGVLRILEIPNCLASVTGATKDNIGGCIYS